MDIPHSEDLQARLVEWLRPFMVKLQPVFEAPDATPERRWRKMTEVLTEMLQPLCPDSTVLQQFQAMFDRLGDELSKTPLDKVSYGQLRELVAKWALDATGMADAESVEDRFLGPWSAETVNLVMGRIPLLGSVAKELGEPRLSHYLRSPLPPQRESANEKDLQREVSLQAESRGVGPATIWRQTTADAFILAVTAGFQSKHAPSQAGEQPNRTEPTYSMPARQYGRWIARRTADGVMGALVPDWRLIERDRRRGGAGAYPQLVSLFADATDGDDKSDLAELIPDDEATPSEVLIERETSEELRAQLHHIIEQANSSELGLLRHIAEGSSIADAARKLGMTPETGRTHLHRLRKRKTRPKKV